MKKSLLTAYGAIITAMLFWSLSFIWYKEAYVNFSPVTVIFLRLIIACIMLLFTAFLFFKIQKVHKKHFWLFFWLAFFEPFLYFMAEGHVLNYISATPASVIISLIPILTPFAAWLFLKHTINPLNMAGLAISFFGVGLVVFAGSTDLSANSFGVALMFLAVLAALGYSMVLVKLLKFYNTITVMTFQNLIALLLFLPFFLIFEVKDFLKIPFEFQTYLPIFKLGFFASFLAFTLFVYSIKRIGITIANMFTYLIPAFTALFAYLILNEELYLQTILGIVVVIFGLTLPSIPKILHKEKLNIDETVEEALSETESAPIIP